MEAGATNTFREFYAGVSTWADAGAGRSDQPEADRLCLVWGIFPRSALFRWSCRRQWLWGWNSLAPEAARGRSTATSRLIDARTPNDEDLGRVPAEMGNPRPGRKQFPRSGRDNNRLIRGVKPPWPVIIVAQVWRVLMFN